MLKTMRRLAMVVLLAFPLAAHSGSPATSGAEVRGAATVMDGDTLKVAGQRICLHAIDTPELRQTCWDDRGEYACGRRAGLPPP